MCGLAVSLTLWLHTLDEIFQPNGFISWQCCTFLSFCSWCSFYAHQPSMQHGAKGEQRTIHSPITQRENGKAKHNKNENTHTHSTHMAIVGTSAGGKSFSFLIKNYYYIIHTFNFLLCFCLGEGRLGWGFCYYGYIRRYIYTAARPAGRWQDMWHKTIGKPLSEKLMVVYRFVCVCTHNTSYYTLT